jgi:hypothetical protein
MKSILSGVLRRKNTAECREGRAGALRIEFIELSRDESMGVESLFVGEGVEGSVGIPAVEGALAGF